MMARRDRSSSHGHQPSEDSSADDIFADPKQQHQQRSQQHQQPRRNRACDENGKQQQQVRKQKRLRNRNRDQKDHQSKKNTGQTVSSEMEPGNDIFALPSEQQQVHEQEQNRLPRQQQATKDHHQLTGAQNQQLPKKNQRRKKRKQQHQEVASVSTSTNRESDETTIGATMHTLEWHSPSGYVPLQEEESMVQFMFQRNGKRERGMMKDKPAFVVSKYRKALRETAPTMKLPQVLSLRRHHIKLFNEYKNMTQLGLGTRDDINESARIFECAVEAFLTKSSIDFRTEEQQLEEAKKAKEVLKATPDFLLTKPIVLRKIRTIKSKKGKSIHKKHHVLEERTIHWIEAKMYYGASTIPSGTKGAVGGILATAQKYVNAFGEGAILFMMGCGEKLASEINDIGVSTLDCSGNTVSLDQVHDHQRTWCANEKGQILP